MYLHHHHHDDNNTAASDLFYHFSKIYDKTKIKYVVSFGGEKKKFGATELCNNIIYDRPTAPRHYHFSRAFIIIYYSFMRRRRRRLRPRAAHFHIYYYRLTGPSRPSKIAGRPVTFGHAATKKKKRRPDPRVNVLFLFGGPAAH